MPSMMATAPPSPPPPASAARPGFVRPRGDRVLSGVCSGLSRHLGIDVALVRTAAVVLTLIGGVGLLIYVAALVLVPEEGRDQPFVRSGRLDDDDRAPLILGGLVLAGIVMGAGPLPWDPWDGGPWLIILAVGVALVVLAARHDRTRGPVSPTVATATAPAPPADAPGEPVTTATATAPAPDDTLVAPPAPPSVPPPDRGPQSRIIGGVVLLAIGVLGLLVSSFDVDLAGDTALAIGVLGLGAGAVAAAPFGGSRLLLLLGFATAGVGGFLTAVDLDLEGGIGERRERPQAVSAFPADGYRLGIGEQRIDLRDVTFPFGTTTLKVRQGIGELRVVVPRDVALVARGRATGGDVRILGRREEGGNPDLEVESPVRAARRLVLDTELTFGEIRVQQDGVEEGEVR